MKGCRETPAWSNGWVIGGNWFHREKENMGLELFLYHICIFNFDFYFFNLPGAWALWRRRTTNMTMRTMTMKKTVAMVRPMYMRMLSAGTSVVTKQCQTESNRLQSLIIYNISNVIFTMLRNLCSPFCLSLAEHWNQYRIFKANRTHILTD